MQAERASLQLLEGTMYLGETALQVQDEASTPRVCCGLLSQASAVHTIPYANILSARVDSEAVLAINYAQHTSDTRVQLATLTYNKRGAIEGAKLRQWAADLEDRAWGHGEIQRNKRIKVLVNPAGGKGKARKLWTRDMQPILQAAGCTYDVEYTSYKGHAVDIAREINVMDYDAVACCSGDGLPHEVFNGLGKRNDARLALAKIAVVQLPCGSGNAMSWNCFGTASPTLAALRLAKSVRMPLDLVSLTQYDPELSQVTRTLSFLSQSVGIIADIDLGTENLRWVGSKRFELGFLLRTLRKTIYPCDIAVATECETKDDVRQHYAERMAKNEILEPERLNAVLKEYQMKEEDREHAAYAGLPELRFGTATDSLPEGWEEVPFDNLGNFYCGNMTIMSADTPFFPAALPNEGLGDLVTIRGDISRRNALDMATKIPEYKLFDMPDVQYRKIAGYRITPKAKSGYISIDGEPIRHATFQAEVHKALGTTMAISGTRYQSKDFE